MSKVIKWISLIRIRFLKVVVIASCFMASFIGCASVIHGITAEKAVTIAKQEMMRQNLEGQFNLSRPFIAWTTEDRHELVEYAIGFDPQVSSPINNFEVICVDARSGKIINRCPR